VELNPTTGATLRSFNAPDLSQANLAGLAFDGRVLYFVSSNRQLYRLDPDTGEQLGMPTSLPTGHYWGLASLGGYLYALDTQAKDILRLDSATGAIVATLDLDAANPGLLSISGLGEYPATGQLVGWNGVGPIFIDPATGVF
jgi:hypothetical protein